MCVEITQRFEIDAGHRIVGHESKCKNVHGHRYVFEVTLTSERLDDLDRVIDFGVIKQIFGRWLDVHWDHAFIAASDEPLLEVLRAGHNKVYRLHKGQPTIENLVVVLLVELNQVLLDLRNADGVTVTRIQGWETPNCSAEIRT